MADEKAQDVENPLATAFHAGGRLTRTLITLLLVTVIGSGGGALYGFLTELEMRSVIALLAIFLSSGLGLGFMIDIGKAAAKEATTEAKIDRLERAVQEKPAPGTAWELARVKLEAYLDRNLKQVGSIYRLVIGISIVGFFLIGFGVYQAAVMPNKPAVAVISAAAGILVQFISATFLVIYRSIMEQAKGHMEVLERINAVGMTTQILEAIEGPDPGERNAVRADVARQLLTLYGRVGRTD